MFLLGYVYRVKVLFLKEIERRYFGSKYGIKEMTDILTVQEYPFVTDRLLLFEFSILKNQGLFS